MRLRSLGRILCFLVLSGCTGTVTPPDGGGPLGDGPGPGGGSGGGPGQPGDPGGGGGSGGGGGGLGNGRDDLPAIVPASVARVGRLTHSQWNSTVRDLFQLDSSAPNWAATFRSDPREGGFLFDNGADALVVDEALQAAYRRAAEAVANYVTANDDTTPLARFLPDSGSDEERVRAFIESFGERAHRRPLSQTEVDAYLAVYEVGRSNPLGAPAFVAGLRLVVQAFLASPRFLYRVELSDAVDGDRVPLDNFELASRLSYMLWNTMPDDALFEAARQGSLTDPTELRSQAERMLADPRALYVSERFHDVLLDISRYDNISPATDAFPDVSPNLAALAREETHLVMREAFENDMSWGELMTTTETWVNQDLAPLYGLSGSFGPDFEKASLDPAERRGLFTQIGFLTSHATAYQPDPIHRGVYLTERVVCNPLGAPPNDLPPLPPPEGRTNRELVADHTEQPGSVCATCHTGLINPFGFAYENYDAAGQIRTVDNGHPIETQAEPLFGADTVPVANALELADELAASERVHACYAEHWVEYAFGRKITEEDEGLIANMAAASLSGRGIRSLLADLVTSTAFMNRSPEDLQ